MNEQEELFSKNHKRLLGIATWSKHMAWVVLIVYILSTTRTIFEFQNTASYYPAFLNQSTQSLLDLLSDPRKLFQLSVEASVTLSTGVVYYLVLKGISLGLHMIVETDINYREKQGEQDE